MDATAVSVYDDDQFTIERNEEHPPGSLARRDLTLEEIQGPPPRPQPENLRNCLVDGSLDMMAAVRIIQWDKKQRRFSQGSYEEFIRFAGSFGINRFQFDAFKEIESCEEFRALVTDALQLMSDVLVSRSILIDRRITSSPPESSSALPTGSFSVSNCTRTWTLDAKEPFVKVDLISKALHWTPNTRETALVQSLSLFRYLLKEITKPSEKIKEYAVRLNGRAGRNGNLKNLPDEVERTLLDFAEDLLGYGREELRFGAVFDRARSRFFLGLGNTDEERYAQMEKLVAERECWRKNLIRSLQRALSDLRSSRYDI